LDLFAADDTEQLNLYKKYFPLLYEHPAVKGVTLWGYRTNEFGIGTSGLLNGTTERPALKWLKT
jgi:endo-1,4-beta-xylanase